MSETKLSGTADLWRTAFEQELALIKLANPEYRRLKDGEKVMKSGAEAVTAEVSLSRAAAMAGDETTEAITQA